MKKYIVNPYAYNPTAEHNRLAWAAIRRLAGHNNGKPLSIWEYANVVPGKHPIGTQVQHIEYVIAHCGLLEVV